MLTAQALSRLRLIYHEIEVIIEIRDKAFMFVNESFKSSPFFTTMGAARIKLSPIGIVVLGLVFVAIIYYLSTDGGSGEFSQRYFEGEDTVSMERLIRTAIYLAEKGGNIVRKIRKGEDLGVSIRADISLISLSLLKQQTLYPYSNQLPLTGVNIYKDYLF